MKPLGKTRIDEVLQIEVDKKALSLRTPLPNMPTEESMRANLQGLAGTALVVVQRSEKRPAGFVEPDRFTLTVVDYPAPKQTVTVGVNATAQPNQLTISKTVQFQNGPFHQVILTQQRGPQSSGAGVFQLIVTDSRIAGAAPEQLNYESADFFSFIREHPQQANQFIRPLLRELGQESVFGPEPMIAWQVFSELWQVDPSMERKIRRLLPALDADDFHTRDASLAQLQALGRDGACALMHMDRSKLTPEQNARIDRALLPYAQIPLKEVVRLRSDPGFLLDCLYAEDARLRKAAIERLRAITRPDLSFDVNADAAARSTAITALRQQIMPTAVR